MVHLKGPIKSWYMLLGEDWIINPLLAKVPVHLRRTEYSPLPLSPSLWSYKSTDAKMKLLLYCWRPCLAVTTTLFHLYLVFTTAHPLCMPKMWSFRVLSSGQPIYIKCRQHCWLFRCCTRLYHVHNLIFCIFCRCYNMTFRIQPLCYRGFI